MARASITTVEENDAPPGERRVRAKLDTIADVRREMAKLYRMARSETLDVQDAARLANILMLIGRLIEGGELEKRLEALEGRI
ncbi:hypothetical protein GGR16_005091 [Chelatococcus caeni]|uniref:Uncharacterized protein n=1 Tax=Chelatococcus caeni TaxID=1348468 RepID=A0A840C9I2_9HYPH|nr:hypothetical protein [Chelatococcus caeni]MBB4020029.1 hypothetical protein [Chelatococcus caeni]